MDIGKKCYFYLSVHSKDYVGFLKDTNPVITPKLKLVMVKKLIRRFNKSKVLSAYAGKQSTIRFRIDCRSSITKVNTPFKSPYRLTTLNLFTLMEILLEQSLRAVATVM